MTPLRRPPSATTGPAGEPRGWGQATTGPAGSARGSCGASTTGSTTGPARTNGTAAGLATSGTAGLCLLPDKNERPLVVMVPAQIESDRLVLALAPDPHHAARDRAAAHGAAGRRAAAGSKTS